MIDKEKHKARWKGKTVKQLIDLMFTFEVIICRTEEESQAIADAMQVLDDLIKEKLQNEVNHG